MVDRRGAGGDGTSPGCHEDSEGLAVTAAARLDEVVATENLAGGPDGVERIALAAAPPWWTLGPAHLDDAFNLLDKELGESGDDDCR